MISVIIVIFAGAQLISGPKGTVPAEDEQVVSQQRSDSQEPSKSRTHEDASTKESESPANRAPKIKGEFRVSGPTTEPFGKAVKDAFIEKYRADGKSPQSVTAFSPRTQQTYETTCIRRMPMRFIEPAVVMPMSSSINAHWN